MLAGVSTALWCCPQRWLLPLLGFWLRPRQGRPGQSTILLLLSSLLLSGLSALWRAVLTAHEAFRSNRYCSDLYSRCHCGVSTDSRAHVAHICTGLWIGTWRHGRARRQRLCSLPSRYFFGSTLDWPQQPPAPNPFPICSSCRCGHADGINYTLSINRWPPVLNPGAVSALNYANRLPAMLFGVGATSLSIAVFPALSRLRQPISGAVCVM